MHCATLGGYRRSSPRRTQVLGAVPPPRSGEGVALLTRHPEIGRTNQPAFRNLREVVIGFGGSAYVVSYRFDGHEVVIVGVRHGREMGR